MNSAERLDPAQFALTLDFRPALDRAHFEVTASNQAAAALIDAWPAWPGPASMLAGPPGSGKTHLAQIWAARAKAGTLGGAAVTVDAVPALVAEYPALAIESAERAEEHALLHLLNLQAESGGWLLLTAATPPAYWPIRLPDLASRLRAMPLCRIAPPDDRLLAAVVAKRFADRGIEVSAAIAPLIVTRIERSFAAADRMVAEIDRAALAAGRAVTAAFVREILERDSIRS